MKAFYSTARTAFSTPLPQGEDQGEGGSLSQFAAKRVLTRNGSGEGLGSISWLNLSEHSANQTVAKVSNTIDTEMVRWTQTWRKEPFS
jgi:hypothetical protein